MNKDTTVFVSPFHDIPPNSTNIDYKRGLFEDPENGGSIGEIEVVGPPPNVGLAAPAGVTIKSHVVKTAADGTQTVDVTFEIEEVPGATGYRLQTTKL